MMSGLTARNIAFAYQARPVLTDVSLKLKPGETVSLLGPNGSGKSTLLKILLGLTQPASGQVLLEGEAIGSLSRSRVAQKLAYVPQDHVMAFPYQVADVVLMGRLPSVGMFGRYRDEDRGIALESLEKMRIGHLAERRYNEVSGGERQMVLIARALAQGARTLIMDEPVSGLDFGNQLLLLSRLRSLAEQGYAVLHTTHYPDHARLVSTRVLMLKGGRVIADGAPQDVISEASLSDLYDIAPREAELLARCGGFRI